MRRLGLLALATGLVLSVLPAVPAEVGAQTTVTLSWVDSSGNAVTAVGEDIGSRDLRLKASVTSAPSSDLRVSLATPSGTASGTTWRDARTAEDYRFGRSPRIVCNGADYCVNAPASITIRAHTTTRTDFATKFYLKSDRITEEHETILIGGTASGYTVNGATLRITDQDRTIKVEFHRTL